MAERGGPSLKEIARDKDSKIAKQGTTSVKTSGLSEPQLSHLVKRDSERYHGKHKEAIAERPDQAVYVEDQRDLVSVTAMPSGSVGSTSVTSASGQAVDQAQAQTPASSMTDTPAEAIDALAEQKRQSQATIQAGSVVEQGATSAADAMNDSAEHKIAGGTGGQSAEFSKSAGEETSGISSQQSEEGAQEAASEAPTTSPTSQDATPKAEGAQEAASEAPATAAEEQGKGQDCGYGYGY